MKYLLLMLVVLTSCTKQITMTSFSDDQSVADNLVTFQQNAPINIQAPAGAISLKNGIFNMNSNAKVGTWAFKVTGTIEMTGLKFYIDDIKRPATIDVVGDTVYVNLNKQFILPAGDHIYNLKANVQSGNFQFELSYARFVVNQFFIEVTGLPDYGDYIMIGN